MLITGNGVLVRQETSTIGGVWISEARTWIVFVGIPIPTITSSTPSFINIFTISSFNQQAIPVKRPDLTNAGKQNLPLEYPTNSDLNALSHAYIHTPTTHYLYIVLVFLLPTPVFPTFIESRHRFGLDWIGLAWTGSDESGLFLLLEVGVDVHLDGALGLELL